MVRAVSVTADATASLNGGFWGWSVSGVDAFEVLFKSKDINGPVIGSAKVITAGGESHEFFNVAVACNGVFVDLISGTTPKIVVYVGN